MQMELFGLFKKKETAQPAAPAVYTSRIEYRGVAIEIDLNIEQSKAHLAEDYAALEKEGIEKIITERFIPWFKTDEFQDRDDRLIYEGLRIYAITYHYGRIVARYSPTQKEEEFGQFEFCFESGNDYTADMLESTAMQVFVRQGQILKVDGFEV